MLVPSSFILALIFFANMLTPQIQFLDTSVNRLLAGLTSHFQCKASSRLLVATEDQKATLQSGLGSDGLARQSALIGAKCRCFSNGCLGNWRQLEQVVVVVLQILRNQAVTWSYVLFYSNKKGEPEGLIANQSDDLCYN